jgi:hypothetical protein
MGSERRRRQDKIRRRRVGRGDLQKREEEKMT